MEELFVMGRVYCGVGDYGQPAIWFSVNGLSGGSLQVIPSDRIIDFVAEWKCDIRGIEGKPCVCHVDENRISIRYVRPFK